MRTGVFISVCALLLAAVAGQNALLRTHANVPGSAISDCARLGESTIAVQGSECKDTSLDGTPVQVLSHQVFQEGCAGSDLHVMRYLPGSGQQPLVATWCT